VDKVATPVNWKQGEEDPAMRRTLVFARTKRGSNKLSEQLTAAFVKADAIHGNKAQDARERALENFKRGLSRVLVATDPSRAAATHGPSPRLEEAGAPSQAPGAGVLAAPPVQVTVASYSFFRAYFSGSFSNARRQCSAQK
jgi:hypothetical protein